MGIGTPSSQSKIERPIVTIPFLTMIAEAVKDDSLVAGWCR